MEINSETTKEETMQQPAGQLAQQREEELAAREERRERIAQILAARVEELINEDIWEDFSMACAIILEDSKSAKEYKLTVRRKIGEIFNSALRSEDINTDRLRFAKQNIIESIIEFYSQILQNSETSESDKEIYRQEISQIFNAVLESPNVNDEYNRYAKQNIIQSIIKSYSEILQNSETLESDKQIYRQEISQIFNAVLESPNSDHGTHSYEKLFIAEFIIDHYSQIFENSEILESVEEESESETLSHVDRLQAQRAAKGFKKMEK